MKNIKKSGKYQKSLKKHQTVWKVWKSMKSIKKFENDESIWKSSQMYETNMKIKKKHEKAWKCWTNCGQVVKHIKKYGNACAFTFLLEM